MDAPNADADPDVEMLIGLVREADATPYPLETRAMLRGFLAGVREELDVTEEGLRADPERARLALDLVKWAPTFAKLLSMLATTHPAFGPEAELRWYRAVIYTFEVVIHNELDPRTTAAIFSGKVDLETALRNREIERGAGLAPLGWDPPPSAASLSRLPSSVQPPPMPRAPDMDHLVSDHVAVPVPPDSTPLGTMHPRYLGDSPTAQFLASGERSDLYALYKHWAERGGWQIELDGPGLLKVSKGATFVEITIGAAKLGRTPLKIRFAGTRSATFEPRS